MSTSPKPKTVLVFLIQIALALFLGDVFADVFLREFLPDSLATPGVFGSAAVIFWILCWLGETSPEAHKATSPKPLFSKRPHPIFKPQPQRPKIGGRAGLEHQKLCTRGR